MDFTDNTLLELFDSCLNNKERYCKVYDLILKSNDKERFILRIFEINRLYDFVYNKGKSWQDDYNVEQLIHIFLTNKEEAMKILKKYYAALKNMDVLESVINIKEVKDGLNKYSYYKVFTINDIIRNFITSYYHYLFKKYKSDYYVAQRLLIILTNQDYIDDFIKKFFKEEKTYQSLKPYIMSLIFGDCYLYCLLKINESGDNHYMRIIQYIDKKANNDELLFKDDVSEKSIDLQILEYAILFMMQKIQQFDLREEVKEEQQIRTLKKANPLFLWD